MVESDIFVNPSYIVLNVPAPVADGIRGLREHFDPLRADMSVEITLTGSGGLGTIAAGQDPDAVFAEVDRIAGETSPFKTSFECIERFKNTDIFYFSLRDNKPFIELHDKFVNSTINFNPVKFPYTPHCTVHLLGDADDTEEEWLFAIDPPRDEFIINTLSVYSVINDLEVKLLHRVNFSSAER